MQHVQALSCNHLSESMKNSIRNSSGGAPGGKCTSAWGPLKAAPGTWSSRICTRPRFRACCRTPEASQGATFWWQAGQSTGTNGQQRALALRSSSRCLLCRCVRQALLAAACLQGHAVDAKVVCAAQAGSGGPVPLVAGLDGQRWAPCTSLPVSKLRCGAVLAAVLPESRPGPRTAWAATMHASRGQSPESPGNAEGAHSCWTRCL